MDNYSGKNILSREDLNGTFVVCDENGNPIFDSDGRVVKSNNFADIERYNSIGFSIIFVCRANSDGRNGIKKGDIVYFKVNNDRGINSFGRKFESLGSCEDVAEVMAFYLIKNLNEKLGENSILKITPHDFAEGYILQECMRNTTQNYGFSDLEDPIMYGCISKDAVSKSGQIVHGYLLLQYAGITEKSNSSIYLNNVSNYEKAVDGFAKSLKKEGKNILVDPGCSRYNANTIFFDYFFVDGDRHNKNICYELVNKGDGNYIFQPLALLDNGGGLAMQSSNCTKLYQEVSNIINKYGRVDSKDDKLHNPFDVSYSFSFGKNCFLDENICNIFDNLSYTDQLALVLSKNKILFDDFNFMYKNLDFTQALANMSNLGLSVNLKDNGDSDYDFLPNLKKVVNEALKFKKRQISESMSKLLNIEYQDSLFDENENYYIDEFAKIVEENGLSIHIASNAELQKHKEKIANYSQKALN